MTKKMAGVKIIARFYLKSSLISGISPLVRQKSPDGFCKSFGEEKGSWFSQAKV